MPRLSSLRVLAGVVLTLATGSAAALGRQGAANNPFVQLAQLTASDGQANDQLGNSIAVSRNTVVIAAAGVNGDQGAAYVFVKPASGWINMTQVAKLTASDGAEFDFMGTGIGISGDTVIVGAPQAVSVGYNFGPGAGYVFVRPADGWKSMTQTAELTSSPARSGEQLGFAAGIGGNTVLLGGGGTGFVYVRPASGWVNMTQTARLNSAGSKSPGCGLSALALSGNTIVLASATGCGGAEFSGSAFVYEEPTGGWKTPTVPTAKLTSSNAAAFDLFGSSVAITGNTVFVGAPDSTIGSNAYQGAAYLFGP